MPASKFPSILLSLLIFALISCDSSSDASNVMKNTVASDNQASQSAQNSNLQNQSNDFESLTSKEQAKLLAVRYVQKNYGGWAINGSSVRRNYTGFYRIVFDLEKNEAVQTVELNARYFTSEKSENDRYWKIEPAFDLNTPAQKLIAELREAESKLDSCEDRLQNIDVDDIPQDVQDQIIKESK